MVPEDAAGSGQSSLGGNWISVQENITSNWLVSSAYLATQISALGQWVHFWKLEEKGTLLHDGGLDYRTNGYVCHSSLLDDVWAGSVYYLNGPISQKVNMQPGINPLLPP